MRCRLNQLLIGAMMMSGGCATQHYAANTPNAAPRSVTESIGTPAPALAFDPPITADQAQLALDREPREPSAFQGYDEPTITYSYLRSEDQIDDRGRTYLDREAVTYRVGVTTR